MNDRESGERGSEISVQPARHDDDDDDDLFEDKIVQNCARKILQDFQ